MYFQQRNLLNLVYKLRRWAAERNDIAEFVSMSKFANQLEREYKGSTAQTVRHLHDYEYRQEVKPCAK